MNKSWNEIGKIYERPWGTYQTLAIGENYQVKLITVFPGQRFSLQKHFKRKEHWIIVSGQPMVTVNDQMKTFSVGETVDIPIESAHRMENKTDKPVSFIEVQFGDYLCEDDILRLSDDYGRIS